MGLKIILGKNVKYYRHKKKFTQKELTEILDSSANYIGRLEHGQHSPSLEKIENIAKAFEVPAFKLFIAHNNYDLPNRVNLENRGQTDEIKQSIW